MQHYNAKSVEFAMDESFCRTRVNRHHGLLRELRTARDQARALAARKLIKHEAKVARRQRRLARLARRRRR
eukprot:5898430-Alexandrium_andersonii.AAC.1